MMSASEIIFVLTDRELFKNKTWKQANVVMAVVMKNNLLPYIARQT